MIKFPHFKTTLALTLLQLLSFATVTAQGTQQSPAATDMVHLKSGQAYQGIIVEQRPGESIRLWRTVESDTLTVTMDSIDRITRIVAPPPIPKPPRVFDDAHWNVALQVGVGGGDYPFGGLGATVQKHFPRQRSWLGIGVHYYGDKSDFGAYTIPIALHGSYELRTDLQGRFGTLVFLDAGYSINITGNYFDEKTQAQLKYGNGLHTYGGLRFRLNVLRNTGIWADIGYFRHTSTLRYVTTNEKARVKAWNMFLFRGSVFF